MIMSPVLAQTKFADRLLSSETSRNIWNGLYYTLPKIYVVGAITVDLVRGKGVESWMPVWSSALFAVAMLSAAVAVFRNRDF